jgi:hypothetical protein
MSSELIMPKGIYYDRLVRPDGLFTDCGWCSNIIVDRCRYLLAAFMKGDTSSGIQLLKIGQGLEEWDGMPPASPVPTIEQLTDTSPVDVAITSSQIEYLDTEDNPTAGPTQRLSIAITLGPGVPPVASGEADYPMREFGLFGLFGSEEYMIDYVRHPVIRKQAGDTMDRTIRLMF